MSLRARILALFLGLGVLPILLLGIIGYARSMSAVRGLLEAQTSAIAQQVASDLEDRHELRLSELLLLAENAETQRLYFAYSGKSGIPLDSALGHADEYLTNAWSRFGASYRRIDLEALDGQRIFSPGGGRFWGTASELSGQGRLGRFSHWTAVGTCFESRDRGRARGDSQT